MENDLKISILEIGQARPEPLIQFLPLIMDKLIRLLVRPPVISGQIINIGQTAFEAIAIIVRNITVRWFCLITFIVIYFQLLILKFLFVLLIGLTRR